MYFNLLTINLIVYSFIINLPNKGTHFQRTEWDQDSEHHQTLKYFMYCKNGR
jgi:hypothetical protein